MTKLRALLTIPSAVLALALSVPAEAGTLGDYIPGAKKFPVLDKVSVESVKTGQDDVVVVGSIDGQPLRFIQAAGKKGISFAVETVRGPVRLSDFFPEMKDFPGDLALSTNRLVFHEGSLILEADVRAGDIDLALTFDPKSLVAKVTVAAKDVGKAKLANVLTGLKDVPLIDALVLESLTLAPLQRTLAATGRVHAVEGTLSVDVKNGIGAPMVTLKPAKGKMTPGDVFGRLAGVPVIDAFAMESLTYDVRAETLGAKGHFAKAEAVLSLDIKQGLDNPVLMLKPTAPVGLGEVVPLLHDVPGVNAFRLQDIILKDEALSADVILGDETAKLSIDFGGLKAPAKSLILKIVPDRPTLSLAKLFPDLSGVPGIKDFALAGLDFAEKTGSAIASLRIGTGSKAKTAKLSTDKSSSGLRLFKLTSPNLSLADVIPPLGDLAIFRDLAFDTLQITKASIETTVSIGSSTVQVFTGLKDGIVALDFGGLDAASFIPAVGSTVLEKVKLAGSVFVIAKSDNTSSGSLPADMLKKLGNVDPKQVFKKGINLLGSIRKEDLGKLAGLFDKLAIKAPSFPMKGVLPDEVLDFVKDGAKDAKKEVVNAVLDALDITIDVPLPAVPALKDFATFQTARLSISGNSCDDPFWKNLPADMQQKKPTGRLDVSLRGGMTLNLTAFDKKVKSPVSLETLVDFNAGDGARSLSLLGRVDGVWDKPLGIKGLTFEKSGFDFAISGGDGGEKVAISFFSAARLHDKTDLAVDASFSESGGLPRLDHFVLDGPLALSDIAGSLPNAGNFIVHEIKLYPDGIEAQVESKNKLLDARTNLFLFELGTPSGKALVAAIDLGFNAKTKSKQKFSLGKLASIAGLKGAKAKTIQSHLDAMAVANAALILSSEKVFPLPPESLKEGIAKDLFTTIFGKSQVPVKLDNVTFLSDFQADLMGDIGTKLVHGVHGIKIGLSEDAIINGAIGGLFDSDPLSLDLEFLMASSLDLETLQKNGLKLPGFIKAKPAKMGGADKIGIFLKVVDATFEAGLLAGFDVNYNNTAFDFTGTLGVQLAEEEVGLSLSGAMSDTWQNALGIHGFELENVAISGEVQVEPPSIKLGLGGDANLWGHDMSTYGDLSVGLLGEVPIPEGLGVKTTVSDLDVTMYQILNTAMLASNVEFVIDPPMWPVMLVGVVAEVGLSEGYTVIYDKVKGKKVTAGDLAKAPFKDAALLIKDYSKLQAWLFGGKDIYLSFATPGASDANLGIPDGIHFSGKVELLGGAIKSPSLQPNIGWIYKIAQGLYDAGQKGKKAVSHAGHAAGKDAKTDLKDFRQKVTQLHDIIAHEIGVSKKAIAVDYVKPAASDVKAFLDSLKFTQQQAFKLGGLEFTDNRVSLAPFKIASTTKLFGNQEEVELSLKDGKLVLETKTKLAMLGEGDLVLEFDTEKQDFLLIGDYSGNPALQKWLASEIQSGIKQISGTASAKLDALNRDLATAKQVRDTAEHDLTVAQDAIAKVTQDAVDRLRQTTNGYQQAYESANNSYNSCHGWKKYYCQAKWWPRKSLAWDTWQASKQLLADAQDALSKAKSLAVEVHKAEIKVNDAATKVALAAKDVAAASDIKAIVAKGLDAFANDANKMAQLFRLDEAFIAGSLKDVAAGKPLVIQLRFEINGKKYEEFFALSPADASFNAISFGLLPVIAAEHVVESMETTLEKELGPTIGTGLAGKLTTWINAHIYELVGGLRDDLEKRMGDIAYELTQEESKYKKIFDSIDTHAGTFAGSYKDLSDSSNQILSTYKMTDFMPASQVFANRYLAVGHSMLCLGVASNGVDVYQQNCKDIDAERWTAESLDKIQEGYVLLKSKGLCLQARDASDKSGQPLTLAECSGKNDHEKWKFISQDGVFSKFVNRYAQKCLHFNTVNANDKAGYAVWTSCFGADSQGFEVLADAEKPTFHTVERRLQAHNGSCIETDPDFSKYFFKTAQGQATSTREHLLNMQRVQDNALYAGACGNDANSLFNYVEAVDGDLKLVHAQSGWCIVPGPQRDGAAMLMPCDNGKDMYWKVREVGESAFSLRNNQTGGCLDLGASKRGPGNARLAVTAGCQAKPGQVLEFARK